MPVTIHVPTPLRKLTGNEAELQVEARSVAELVDSLESSHEGIKERLVDEEGEIRRYVNIYVNEEDIRFLDGRETVLKDGDRVSIVPAIAGGADSTVQGASFDLLERRTDRNYPRLLTCRVRRDL